VSSSNHKAPVQEQQIWKDRRVLIIGGTGFLGQRLTSRLVEQQAAVAVTVFENDAPDVIARLPQQAHPYAGDVRDIDRISQIVRDVEPEIVYHLAAVGVNDPFIAEETALEVNVQGTLNTLRAVRLTGCDLSNPIMRIVVAGTSYEYGSNGSLDPGNVYAASKVAAWAFCRMHFRAYGTPVVIARPFNVYGPGQSARALVPAAIRAALGGEDFPATPGEQRRDFVHVDDIMDGLLAVAVAPGIEGDSLDLGTGQTTSVRELIELIFELCEGRGRPRLGALPYRPGVVWELCADAEQTYALTGWRAKTGLLEGLKHTIEAFSTS
jgi:UDP-glucose 4-epimerase